GRAVDLRHGPHHDRGGQLAGRLAARAVGDHQQVRPGVSRVLVAVADQADMGAGRITQGQAHQRYFRYFRSSRTVLPIRIGTPTGTGVGPLILVRSRYVPLVEPRSSTTHCPDWSG